VAPLVLWWLSRRRPVCLAVVRFVRELLLPALGLSLLSLAQVLARPVAPWCCLHRLARVVLTELLSAFLAAVVSRMAERSSSVLESHQARQVVR
jgi:hypothetical protein